MTTLFIWMFYFNAKTNRIMSLKREHWDYHKLALCPGFTWVFGLLRVLINSIFFHSGGSTEASVQAPDQILMYSDIR